MVKAIFMKIRNIILMSIMCFSINGSSMPAEAKQQNNFTKDVIIEIIGIDNTVIDFIEYIINNN